MSSTTEYKGKIMQAALQHAAKDGNSGRFNAEELHTKLKSKLELTGVVELDFENASNIIKELLKDLRSDYI